MESLLAAWETGRRQNTAARGITLLGIARPDTAPDALAELTPGERDRWLVRLRQALFGSEAAAVTVCPQCGEILEFDMPLSGMENAPEVSAHGGEIDRDGYRVRFRLPRCNDLVYAARASDVGAGARLLFERCIESAEFGPDTISAGAVPPAMAGEIAGRMEEMDAHGDVRIALACPACSTEWRAVFDIVSFLWTELDAWAVRLLRQVHTLASAYGWREPDILAMSASRREFYLDLVAG
jgi:hypothetical protein